MEIVVIVIEKAKVKGQSLHHHHHRTVIFIVDDLVEESPWLVLDYHVPFHSLAHTHTHKLDRNIRIAGSKKISLSQSCVAETKNSTIREQNVGMYVGCVLFSHTCEAYHIDVTRKSRPFSGCHPYIRV